MNPLRVVETPVPNTGADDPRVGQMIGADATPDNARVVIVGFPCDEGVVRNGGRRGAAGGPAAIREALFRLTPDPESAEAFTALVRSTCDLGDVALTGQLDANQQRLADVLGPHIDRGAIAIVLGGGHETSFGHFLGYVAAGRRIAILNWDAHADVRPLKDSKGHSGSPFRQALEHESGLCAHYTVAGLNPPSVARAHLEYIATHGGAHHFNTSISFSAVESIYAGCENDTFVTFDLDALDQAAAPGVSAPATAGLSPHIWLHAAHRAGQCSTVRSIDIVELCPLHDIDGRTARLAARTVWEFLRGVAQRG